MAPEGCRAPLRVSASVSFCYAGVCGAGAGARSDPPILTGAVYETTVIKHARTATTTATATGTGGFRPAASAVDGPGHFSLPFFYSFLPARGQAEFNKRYCSFSDEETK